METRVLVKVAGTLGGGGSWTSERASSSTESSVARRAAWCTRPTSGTQRFSARASVGQIARGPSPGRLTPAEQEDDKARATHQTVLFRSCAARANYLSLDLPDLAYATKECVGQCELQCTVLELLVAGDLSISMATWTRLARVCGHGFRRRFDAARQAVAFCTASTLWNIGA